jgi:hypothetical protein
VQYLHRAAMASMMLSVQMLPVKSSLDPFHYYKRKHERVAWKQKASDALCIHPKQRTIDPFM